MRFSAALSEPKSIQETALFLPPLGYTWLRCPMPLSVGDKLGPYEILAPIGSGGMGAVFRARDPRLNRDVAIKVSVEQFSPRFEQEAPTRRAKISGRVARALVTRHGDQVASVAAPVAVLFEAARDFSACGGRNWGNSWWWILEIFPRDTTICDSRLLNGNGNSRWHHLDTSHQAPQFIRPSFSEWRETLNIGPPTYRLPAVDYFGNFRQPGASAS
jgi:hypothetical protein